MLEVGSLAPDFALPSHDNDYVKLSRLLEQHELVVVFFFLNAGSPGCTREVSGFNEQIAEYRRRGIAVVGISPDPVSALATFGQELKVGFSLCSDADHGIANEWGTWIEGRQARSSFVVNQKGIVAHAYPRVNVNSHPAELLALLSSEVGEPAAPAAEAPRGEPDSSHGGLAAGAHTPVVASPGGVQAGDVAVAFARTSLQLLLAHVEAGGTIPADVISLAARLAARS